MTCLRIFLIGSVCLIGSGTYGQEFVEHLDSRHLTNQRYEPRRPGQSRLHIDRPLTVTAAKGRFAPTRPSEVRREGSTLIAQDERRFKSTQPVGVYRSEPRRPNEGSRILETAFRTYQIYEGGSEALAVEPIALLRKGAKSGFRKKGKVALAGKVVFIPVKVAYKVVKKVVGKVAIDWWIPLL